MATPVAAFVGCLLYFHALLLWGHASAENSSSCSAGVSFSGNRVYASCNTLLHLNASLHWNYHPSNATVDVAFRAPVSSGGWVAWAINPSGEGMIGANALIAFPNSSNGGAVTVWTTKFTSYSPTVKNESLDFAVYSASAEYAGGVYTIYASLELPGNATKQNTVWQSSTSFQNGVPYGHAGGDNGESKTSLDFLSSTAVASGSGNESNGNNTSTQSTSSCATGVSFSGNRVYGTCNTLPYLSASLHWNYHPSNATVDVAFRAPVSSGGWVAWAINPSGEGMIGANSLIAFPNSSNGDAITVWTTKFTSYSPTVTNESLDFAVYNASAEYADGAYTIYASLELPGKATKQNTVWQSSTSFQNGVPYGHAGGDNSKSMTSLDFLSGTAVASGSGNKLHRRNVHGVLNTISWGILMPIGVIIARYLKVFQTADPAWFYLHITCQFSGYVIGVAGWGLGLKLGSESVGITYHKHRTLGIVLFCLATLQVFALLLRPQKDHKYRMYWNLYHWSVGYSVIVLSIVNIFDGFDILNPDKKWKHAYVGVLAALGAVALVLEVFTWAVVLSRRRKGSDTSYSHHGRGVNGAANGYGGRQNHDA